MKIKTRMIGMDLDGTLLTTQKELTAYTKDVLRRAIDQGIVVMPATGRPIAGVPKELLEIPGIMYAVTANGGRIVDVRTRETIYECLVPPETAERLMDVFEHYDTLREIYYDGIGYAQEDGLMRIDRYLDSQPMIRYMLSTRRTVSDIRKKMKEENRGADKVQGLFVSVEDRDAAREELKAIPGIEATGALEKNIEVNAQGVNKGSVMVRLGERMGICREEIMAFGDGLNDLRMIREVGTGVAMGNARDEVKAAADYIALSNDEEGVARFIEEYVLD